MCHAVMSSTLLVGVRTSVVSLPCVTTSAALHSHRQLATTGAVSKSKPNRLFKSHRYPAEAPAMEGNGQQTAPVTCASGMPMEEGTALLLALPVGVLHQVLGMLDPHDLLQLLQTSKAIAKEVMQHYSGRWAMKLKLQQIGNMAAIRQLLQWAPPACLKLKLDGTRQDSKLHKSDWELVKRVFDTKPTGPGSQEDQDMQQLPSIMEVCIQGFLLPGLVPASLSAACPNLHTLHLQECEVGDQQDMARYRAATGRSSNEAYISGGPAHQLKTLVLEHVQVPHLHCQPFSSIRLTESMPSGAAAQYAEILRAGIPNVSCLKLLGGGSGVEIIEVIGPQLKALHLAVCSTLRNIHGVSKHLQQLQKLVCPCAEIAHPKDMEFLLSLPNLTHVELSSVEHLPWDYSSKPCNWQYLHLHMGREQCSWQYLDALAKLPLHSLTQPLTLGPSQQRDPRDRLTLAISAEPQSLAELQHLALQLKGPGVKLMATRMAWQAPYPNRGDAPLAGAQLAPALRAIAPAFQQCPNVMLRYMVIDKPILEAVAAVYRGTLERLTCCDCAFEVDMQPAWHAALSGLPALKCVELLRSVNSNSELLICIRSLAAAMAQQTKGRCIEVQAINLCIPRSILPQLVMDGAEELLSGVEVTDGVVWGALIKSKYGP